MTIDAVGGRDEELRFRSVDDPQRVRSLIDEERERVADPVPGTVEQWEAVLAEVRALRRALEGE